MVPSPSQDLMPRSALPLAYYVYAYSALLLAFLSLIVDPRLPGASFYHPRMVALLHLLTVGWISGSILGSFYIVGPLALRVPMPVRATDWIAFCAFAGGTAAMVTSFWFGRYEGLLWSGALVLLAITWVGVRALPGLLISPAPAGVIVHVALAFLNMLAAGGAGILLALNRSRGFLEVSPLALVFAHAHVAALGWAGMMVVGLAYRLIPMMLPAAMPTGARLATSAVLLEIGLLLLTVALLFELRLSGPAALCLLAGLASFALQMRQAVGQRMPRPPALPARDWSTWQAHAALLWLLLAAGLGVALAIGVPHAWRLQLMWLYGTAGLVGFLWQIVAGIQGRLVPFYAWYRAFASLGCPPPTAANALPSASFARAIFMAWTIGVPALGLGLPFEIPILIRVGAAALAVGLLLGARYLAWMMARARVV
jgi:hypothetical protein